MKTPASLLLLLAMPLMLGSCGEKSRPAESAGPVTPAVVPKPVDYIALGVPAANREWSPQDYGHAYKALATLPKESLPRLGISSGVYERMVDHENLNLIRNPKLPAEQRMAAAAGYAEGVTSLLRLYLMHPYQSHDLKDETIGLTDISVTCMVLMLPLVDEFMASLPPEEQNNPHRKEGHKKVVAGMEQTFSGGVVCLGETQIWSEEQRAKFAQVLERTLPEAWPRLTEQFKKELPIRLEEQFQASPDGPGKEAIGKVRALVSKL